MLFSEAFDIERTMDDDWFDLIIDTDTPLFVDPFLIFQDTSNGWAGAHDQLIDHFDRCFKLIAEGNCNEVSLQHKKALALLTFPEPREFCLGYTESGTRGSGGGKKLARLMAVAMVAAIKRGMMSLPHFEELGILNERIGPDRISDFTCNVLRSHFIAYTKSVAARHQISIRPVQVPGASYNPARMAWRRENHHLPFNSFNGKPILLVPERFLNHLPALNGEDWWNNYESEQLANDLNYEIMRKVDKKTIVETARRNLESVRRWVAKKEQERVHPYDTQQDPLGVHQWHSAARSHVDQNPLLLPLPQDDGTFFDVIDLVVNEFKRFIEQQGGWRLLWNDGNIRDKPEEAAQLLFMGIARNYCKANDIVVDREVELGRGPVDFKFSNGYAKRALLEIKKLHNGKFWNGLKYQLPSYLESDDCDHGWYVAIRYRASGTSKQWARELPLLIRETTQRTGKNLQLRVLDAMPKESASRIKSV